MWGLGVWSAVLSVFRPVDWFVRCLMTTYVSPWKHILRCHSLPLTCADDLSTKVENICVLLFTSELINKNEMIFLLV